MCFYKEKKKTFNILKNTCVRTLKKHIELRFQNLTGEQISDKIKNILWSLWGHLVTGKCSKEKFGLSVFKDSCFHFLHWEMSMVNRMFSLCPWCPAKAPSRCSSHVGLPLFKIQEQSMTRFEGCRDLITLFGHWGWSLLGVWCQLPAVFSTCSAFLLRCYCYLLNSDSLPALCSSGTISQCCFLGWFPHSDFPAGPHLSLVRFKLTAQGVKSVSGLDQGK